MRFRPKLFQRKRVFGLSDDGDRLFKYLEDIKQNKCDYVIQKFDEQILHLSNDLKVTREEAIDILYECCQEIKQGNVTE